MYFSTNILNLTITNCAFALPNTEVFYVYDGPLSHEELHARLRTALEPLMSPAGLALTALKRVPRVTRTDGPGASLRVLTAGAAVDVAATRCAVGAFVNVPGPGQYLANIALN